MTCVTCDEIDGCHVHRGCGTVWVDGKNVTVYRFIYEQENGPVPPNHCLHMTCGNRKCCNPDHIELRERAMPWHEVNFRGSRSERPKHFCPHGHMYEDKPFFRRMTSTGIRRCWRCVTGANQLAYAKKKLRAFLQSGKGEWCHVTFFGNVWGFSKTEAKWLGCIYSFEEWSQMTPESPVLRAIHRDAWIWWKNYGYLVLRCIREIQKASGK